ncbi:MAG: FIST N-terminal domain-containing protein [Planctomycetota bacterium]
MQAHSALSCASQLDQAIAEVADSIPFRPELCLAFATPGLGDLSRLPSELGRRLDGVPVVGGSGAGVLANGQETENGAALGLLALDLDGSSVEVRHFETDSLPSDDGPPGDWVEAIGMSREDCGGLLICADPFSMDSEALVRGLDFGLPAAPKVGGLVSGGGPGSQTLFCGDAAREAGAVTVALGNDIELEPVVARGCRPVGRTGTVSSAKGQIVHRIDDQPALDFLRQQAAESRGGSMFLGVESDPLDPTEPSVDDFLIRNFVGSDDASGSVAIGALVGAGRRVRLHVRDKDASRLDLHERLASARSEAKAALLFSCLGRGQALFGERHHDSNAIRQRYPEVALCGAFCNGEIGPVGGVSYVHGYTASIALLSQRTSDPT